MCQKCVDDGEMTQEELDKELNEVVDLLNSIGQLLENKVENVVMEALTRLLFRAIKHYDINPLLVIEFIVKEFDIPHLAIPTPSENKKGITH